MNWDRLIRCFHGIDHPDDPHGLVLGPPANAQVIASLEEKIGFILPQEFHTLYTQIDGFGHRAEGNRDPDWFFLPIEQIPAFSEETRDWFRETHPKTADRLISFIDWGSGDSVGYLKSPEGRLFDGLFIFEHEAYEFDARQDPDEFLLVQDSSIAEFLKM